MNDKPGGTPDHLSPNPGAAGATGMGAAGASAARPTTNSPSNFGARPAPSAPPVAPISDGPSTFGQQPGTISGAPKPAPGMNTANFQDPLVNQTATTNMPPQPTIVNPMPNTPVAEGLNRPMTKAAPGVVPKKQPNKKLIFGIIGGVIALVLIIAVAAVAVVMLNKGDPVAKAVDKLLTTGLPTNMTVKADVNAQLGNEDEVVSHYKITATANMMPATLTNEANATVTMGGRNMDDTTFQLSEIYAGEDNLFLMVDGLGTALEAVMDASDFTANETVTDEEECIDEYGDAMECEIEDVDAGDDEATDETEVIDEATDEELTDETEVSGEFGQMIGQMMGQMIVGIVQRIDGQWIKVDTSALSGMTGSTSGTTGTSGWTSSDTEVDEEETIDATDLVTNVTGVSSLEEAATTGMLGSMNLTCDINLVQKIRDNAGTMAQIYRNNPFIEGSNEKVALASKSYPVYRIVIDQENYVAFIAALQNQGLLADYMKCSGATVSEMNNWPSRLPVIYTEVDGNSNFTRFYLSTTNEGTTVMMNLDLSYPANINVKEPQSYVTLQEALQNAVSELMGSGTLDWATGIEEGMVTVDENTE